MLDKDLQNNGLLKDSFPNVSCYINKNSSSRI